MPAATVPSASLRYDSDRRRGVGFVIACASIYSVNTLLARLAFESGVDAATANVARFSVTVLVSLVILAVRRQSAYLPPRERLFALGVGLLYFGTSFGFLGAIQYIPISVAVLILYTFPLLVGVIERVLGRQRLGWMRVVALLLAFAGLALALDPRTGGPLDWRGLPFIALSAVSMALMITASARLLRPADTLTINLYFMTAATALFLVNLAIVGGPSLPSTDEGWLPFAGFVATFVAGQLCFVLAIERAGSVLTAAVMNLEPVITIALAVLILGERPRLMQLAGGALVLAALLLMRRGGIVMANLARLRPAAGRVGSTAPRE